MIVARSIRTLLSAGIFAAAAWVPDALAAAGTAPTGFADRGRTPSASELAALRQKLADQQLVRLMGPSISERDIERPLVDSSGVRSANWTPRRSVRAHEQPAPPAHAEAPVPWSQITEIQTGHTMTNRGMLIGAALGLFASGFVMTGITRSSSSGEAGLATLVVVPVALVTGALIGASIGHSQWRGDPVYRADAAP